MYSRISSLACCLAAVVTLGVALVEPCRAAPGNGSNGAVLGEGRSEAGCIDQNGKPVLCPVNFMPGSCPLPAGCDPRDPFDVRQVHGHQRVQLQHPAQYAPRHGE